MVRNNQLDRSLLEKGQAAWKKASEAEIEEAIKHATQFIDTLPFKGRHLKITQALSWPRKDAFRKDGAPIVGVPEEVKEATGMVAGFILAKIPFDVPALAWVMLKLGPLLENDKDDLREGRSSWH